MAEPTREEFLELATSIVKASEDKLRIAYNEQDDSKDKDLEAAHFFKLNEKRVGRDIELYGFTANIAGWQQALVMFLEEVVLPIKKSAPSAYKYAVESLKEMGKRVFPSERLSEWESILNS